ncbi:hypothetical protein PMI07_005787 [Rhizobium sp. CF080]|nr:hypothetical protein PMI07_005787 [Rhizobium sp. CF080]
MFNPEKPQIFAATSPRRKCAPVRALFVVIPSGDKRPAKSSAMDRQSVEGLRIRDLWQIAAPKQEQAFFGVCLLSVWLMSAASLSGYVILALFLLVALGRFIRHVVTTFARTLPKRSQLRRYLLMCTAIAFFSLLVVRSCYLAAVIVDTEFRSDPFDVGNASNNVEK